MADELARNADEPEGPVTLERAARILHQELGPLHDAEYLPGKTDLRDVLVARLDLSQLEAEEVCDELERADRIRFVRTAEGAAWHIPGEGAG